MGECGLSFDCKRWGCRASLEKLHFHELPLQLTDSLVGVQGVTDQVQQLL